MSDCCILWRHPCSLIRVMSLAILKRSYYFNALASKQCSVSLWKCQEWKYWLIRLELYCGDCLIGKYDRVMMMDHTPGNHISFCWRPLMSRGGRSDILGAAHFAAYKCIWLTFSSFSLVFMRDLFDFRSQCRQYTKYIFPLKVEVEFMRVYTVQFCLRIQHSHSFFPP